MICLTYTESQAWLASFDAQIIAHRHISFPRIAQKERRAFLPNLEISASKVTFLSTQLVDWLPNGCNRLLWLRNWETYPPDQLIFFETVRRGCKEPKHAIEAPGHLFQSSNYNRDDYESRTAEDHEENALMAGLFSLMICFNWDGYLVAANQDHIVLQDNSLTFSTLNDSKLKDAFAIVDKFGLRFREQKT